MIYLCKPGGEVFGALNGIDEGTASLTQSVSEVWTLTFEVQRYLSAGEELLQTDYYSSITEMMELLLVTDEFQTRFIIDVEPNTTGDGVYEKKTVTAHSIENELSTKFLKQFKVNCGTTDSQEYLVGYYDENGDFINMNLNPYTNLPVDYIVVKNDYAERLTEAKNYLNSQNLRVSSSNGLIQNTALYPYLKELFEAYPRLGCDTYYSDGEYDCEVYLTMVDADNSYGYEFYLGTNSSSFSKSYLINGIGKLISYYETYGRQLSLIDLALEKGQAAGWSVGDIPSDIRNKKYNFTIEQQDILSFFKQKATQSMKVLFDFDRYARKVSIIDIATMDTEYDTGVFLTFRNLLKTVDVKTSTTDGIRTKLTPKGNNNLGILYVNFGENSILNLDYVMDKIDEYGNYQFVSEELHDKYHQWVQYRENTPYSLTVNGTRQSYESRREAYKELSRQYNQSMIEIDAFKNMLPNDGCEIDYTTFTFDELNVAYKAYMNALEALEQLYMADVGAVSFKRDTQYAVDAAGNECTNIDDTFYGLDFHCYYDTIIPNVMTALVAYVNTKGAETLNQDDPDQYDSEKGEWISWEGGNPLYNSNPKIVTENMSNVWLYDMSLYGIVEAEAKQKAWRECAAVMYKPGYVLRNGTVIDPIPAENFTYNTADAAGYARLSEEQRGKFTGEASFIKAMNEYLDYVSTTERDNGLTKKRSKGVIALAQERIDELQPQVDEMEGKQENIQTARKAIANDVLLENWSGFSTEDLELIYTLTREADYTNANILITNLDTIATTVDAQEELYQDALIELSERSQPQLAFTAGIDNLFALPEFSGFQKNVRLLHFIRVSIGLYEDEFIKLRVISIKRNPLIPTEELEIGFSNMTYSLQGLSDLAALFEGLNGSGATTSGGVTSSGGGSYGDNDAEITIANNMLSALLRSKTYTRSIGQTMVDRLSNDGITKILMAHSGLFDKLTTGDIVVSGDCVTDHIKSSNYNAQTKEGSYLALKDGTFTYADGKLTWDGNTLHIDGGVQIGDNSDGLSKVLTTIGEAIQSEVRRATGAENALTASYSGAYIPSAKNYPASTWNDKETKEIHENDTFYDTTNGQTYVWTKAQDGVMVRFNSQCMTERNYDYVRIYYQDKNGKFPMTDKLTGGRGNSVNNIANAAIFVPASTFYVYWYSDVSISDLYGFKIDSVEYVSAGTAEFLSNNSLPITVSSVVDRDHLPESAHNYGDNEEVLYQVNTGYTISDDPEAYRWVLVQDQVIQEAYSRISQTEDRIAAEVARATGVESSLSTLIEQTAEEVSSAVKEGDDIVNLINQSAYGTKIQAKNIDLVLGGRNNNDGALTVKNYSGTQIGRWDNSGIYAINGDFSGQISNGYNTFSSDGRFSLGNGALTYDPAVDQYVHLTSNMSLLYNDVPLVGKNVANEVTMGFNWNKGWIFDYDSQRFYYGTLWTYSDGQVVSRTESYVIYTPASVYVYFKFWIAGTSRSIPKESIMFPGLPPAEFYGLPIEFKKINTSGYFDGTTKMGHLYSWGDGACVYVDQAITGNTTTKEDFWTCYFTYYPRQ